MKHRIAVGVFAAAVLTTASMTAGEALKSGPAVGEAIYSKELGRGPFHPLNCNGAKADMPILAFLLVQALFGDAVRAGVSTPHVPDGTAVAIEAVLTWLLVVVILGTADRHRIVGPNAALAVGATIALCGLIALPIEGASMNPARSAGPALVTGDVGNLWIYILGPLIGASLAVVLMRFLHGRQPEADAAAARIVRLPARNPEELLEDALAMLGRYAGAFVADGQHNHITRLPQTEMGFLAVCHGILDEVGDAAPQRDRPL
jgi:aquaporin Z